MANTQTKILEVLELLNDEWKSTNSIYLKGKSFGVYNRRETYEKNLKSLYEKGYIELKENQINNAVRRFWRKTKT